ncbi:MAG: citrate lyase subunit beta [Clostridiales bacterium]|nr:citrate lyase subunit beta [Clostridiales bacterium]
MYKMRTMLFCPANKPKMYLNAPVFKPDCILFDLEDAVAMSEKDAGRDLLCKAVETLEFGDCMVFARVNGTGTPFFEEDVRSIVPSGIRYMRLAMCDCPDDVVVLDQLLTEVEKANGIEVGTVKIQCSIETAKGVLNARETVKASDRVISLSFGAEDYTNSMGTVRTREGNELSYARTYLPVVAAEAGITAVDTVWSNYKDEEGFAEEVKWAKTLGFTGKSCIHPSQIKIAHTLLSPSAEEIEHAQRVVDAEREATAAGIGVFTVDNKMVDYPIINKARRILIQAGRLEK